MASATADFTSPGTGLEVINTLLAEEANRIGSDIHKQTLHTSPWIDLIKQSAFPDEMGYQLTSLVYDRAIPTTNATGGTAGVTWQDVAEASEGTGAFGTTSKVLGEQNVKDAATQFSGGRGNASTDYRSYVQFSKKIKQYNLKKAAIESPTIGLDDLRFAAQRKSQLSAIMDLMAEASRHAWETRYRDEFERIAANVIICETTGTAIRTDNIDDSSNAGESPITTTESFEGVSLSGYDHTSTLGINVENSSTAGAGTNLSASMANISNAVLDKAYYQLIRAGGGNNAYGRENGRPVFSLVCSSEASYQLQTEAGFRDDVRYNNAKVSDLIAPLGIEKSFRGFYHLIDDLAPRFEDDDNDGLLTAVPAYSISTGIVSSNAAYETANYEAAYILHPDVMESQIPNPLTGAGSIKFDPVNYKGDFKWLNIPHAADNPDGTIGFFRGVLASASKPIKTNFGYVIIFKRDSTTPAA